MAESPLQNPVQTSVNPLSLAPLELARLLTAAGSRLVTAESVQADLARGAPVGPGGRINLVHYTAWLLREAQRDGR